MTEISERLAADWHYRNFPAWSCIPTALLTEASEAIRRLEGENAELLTEMRRCMVLAQADHERVKAAEAERDQALAVLKLAADIRWSELAAGSQFTFIDRLMLGDLHEDAARVLALLYGGQGDHGGLPSQPCADGVPARPDATAEPSAALREIDRLATEFITPEATSDDVDDLLGQICSLARASLYALSRPTPDPGAVGRGS